MILQHPRRHDMINRHTNYKAASDAIAYEEGVQTLPCVGGWWADQQWPKKQECQWFSVQIPRTQAWAFKGGASQRRIAALELMGTTILYKLMAPDIKGKDMTITTTLSTDNMGNAHGINKDRCKKWPTADILAELTLTAHLAGTRLAARHVKRDQNEWADQLTHEDFSGYDMKKRRHFDMEADSSWHIWHLLRNAQE